jgi:hypothetical protein
MDHSGTGIVPRKITAALSRAAGRPVPQDPHGQFLLSDHDIVFIRNRAHSAFAAHGMEHFFDAVQPAAPGHDKTATPKAPRAGHDPPATAR